MNKDLRKGTMLGGSLVTGIFLAKMTGVAVACSQTQIGKVAVYAGGMLTSFALGKLVSEVMDEYLPAED